jgi:hypothetical protein
MPHESENYFSTRTASHSCPSREGVCGKIMLLNTAAGYGHKLKQGHGHKTSQPG